MEALERQLATLLTQVGETEDRRMRGEELVRAELADASTLHDAGIHALRHDLAEATARLEEQHALHKRLANDVAPLVASLTTSRAGHSEHIAEMRQLLARRLGQAAGSQRLEQAGLDDGGDDLLLLQSSAIRALHVDIGRLSRRLDLDAEEAARTAAALVERIEAKRTAGTLPDTGELAGGDKI